MRSFDDDGDDMEDSDKKQKRREVGYITMEAIYVLDKTCTLSPEIETGRALPPSFTAVGIAFNQSR